MRGIKFTRKRLKEIQKELVSRLEEPGLSYDKECRLRGMIEQCMAFRRECFSNDEVFVTDVRTRLENMEIRSLIREDPHSTDARYLQGVLDFNREYLGVK